MSADKIAVKTNWKNNAHLDKNNYEKFYEKSINDPEGFWSEQALNIDWHKPFTKDAIKKVNFSKDNLEIKWFYDGKLNVSYNCIDRHLKTKSDNTAIIWEGDNPNESKNITYKELKEKVALFGGALKNQGVKKGDRVIIYMPMIPEAVVAMLACGRIGAVHSVVFAGFSAAALAARINDASCKVLLTADGGFRGDKITPLKSIADEALKD